MKALFTFISLAGFVLTDCSSSWAQRERIQNEELRAYTHCTFADGLEIVALDDLAPGVTARTVETSSGNIPVPMLAGVRVMFAYPNTDFFANVKAERLPSSQYSELKQILIENFDYLRASSPSFRINDAVGSLSRLLQVRGMDRDKLEGGTLGFYLIFDDKKQVVVTIYLLNQKPEQRKFQSLDEYRRMRDQFLSGYAACIVGNRWHSAMVPAFANTREAKQFIVDCTVAQAQRDGVPFSEVETKMLCFSETGWTAMGHLDRAVGVLVNTTP